MKTATHIEVANATLLPGPRAERVVPLLYKTVDWFAAALLFFIIASILLLSQNNILGLSLLFMGGAGIVPIVKAWRYLGAQCKKFGIKPTRISIKK